MQQYSRTPCPPAPGDRWRLNFSRVEWEVESHQGGYRKKEDMPCANWVWTAALSPPDSGWPHVMT